MKKKQIEQKLTVRFPVGLLDKLRELAKEDQRSLNGQIIWILNQYTEKEVKKNDSR